MFHCKPATQWASTCAHTPGLNTRLELCLNPAVRVSGPWCPHLPIVKRRKQLTVDIWCWTHAQIVFKFRLAFKFFVVRLQVFWGVFFGNLVGVFKQCNSNHRVFTAPVTCGRHHGPAPRSRVFCTLPPLCPGPLESPQWGHTVFVRNGVVFLLFSINPISAAHPQPSTDRNPSSSLPREIRKWL